MLYILKNDREKPQLDYYTIRFEIIFSFNELIEKTKFLNSGLMWLLPQCQPE
jgi:hypothetical protein